MQDKYKSRIWRTGIKSTAFIIGLYITGHFLYKTIDLVTQKLTQNPIKIEINHKGSLETKLTTPIDLKIEGLPKIPDRGSKENPVHTIIDKK